MQLLGWRGRECYIWFARRRGRGPHANPVQRPLPLDGSPLLDGATQIWPILGAAQGHLLIQRANGCATLQLFDDRVQGIVGGVLPRSGLVTSVQSPLLALSDDFLDGSGDERQLVRKRPDNTNTRNILPVDCTDGPHEGRCIRDGQVIGSPSARRSDRAFDGGTLC